MKLYIAAFIFSFLFHFTTALAADTLLKDGQVVELDYSSGPATLVKGSQGMGKFKQTFRAKSNTFGPAKVLEHGSGKLVFKTRTARCTLKTDGNANCTDGSKGVWR